VETYHLWQEQLVVPDRDYFAPGYLGPQAELDRVIDRFQRVVSIDAALHVEPIPNPDLTGWVPLGWLGMAHKAGHKELVLLYLMALG
jgi:hypothetical protein